LAVIHRIRRIALLSACAAFSIQACGGGDNSSTTDASSDVSAQADAATGGDVTVSDGSVVDVVVDGPTKQPCTVSQDKIGYTNRTASGNPYVAYVPASYNPNVLTPLVIALHGAGDTAMNYLSVIWQGNADADGFIVIAPEGTDPLGGGYTWDTTDVPLILAAAVDVYNCYAVDWRKEIMHGFSAGGIMAYLIGLEKASLFSGISISSADLGSAEAVYGGSLLPSAWEIPVSHFHGTQDQNFPISYAITGMEELIEAGHPFYWHPFDGGHTTTAAFANTMYMDLKSYTAP
jgi:poly(3-hydroxybutyrate) depolymerase